MIRISPNWKAQERDSSVGLLAIRGAPNVPDNPELKKAKKVLEEELRVRYAGMDRKALREEPVLAAYNAFYRRFRKSYHVQLQLESVVIKGKPIFSPSALVTCMFMAELKTGLLTAAHDFDSLDLPLTAEIAAGEETYQQLNGTKKQLKAGDLYIRDQQGILSSVIYGPDQRTQIRPDTVNSLFTTYGPPGITVSQVEAQLEILEGYIRLFAPEATRDHLVVLP
jgi:DNA/RNA-binding domain of Phe-tRNA-synthetase-like protein